MHADRNRPRQGAAAICGVPVVGDLDAVAKVARLKQEHHVVSVFATAGWSSARLHRLAWDVEEVGVELVVDPRLTEVAGPRLRVEPMDGLPLLRLTHPALTDVSTLVKALIDRIGAAMLLLVLAPLLLGLAVGIRSGGGQVLRRQTHVGRSGRRFALLRFRSTRTDPARRATKLDGSIRRNGLDELPQLFNVLSGSMSLIGPRPARPDGGSGPLPSGDPRRGHRPPGPDRSLAERRERSTVAGGGHPARRALSGALVADGGRCNRLAVGEGGGTVRRRLLIAQLGGDAAVSWRAAPYRSVEHADEGLERTGAKPPGLHGSALLSDWRYPGRRVRCGKSEVVGPGPPEPCR